MQTHADGFHVVARRVGDNCYWHGEVLLLRKGGDGLCNRTAAVLIQSKRSPEREGFSVTYLEPEANGNYADSDKPAAMRRYRP